MMISKPQLGRLQTLYSQYAAHEAGAGATREARIAWAEERLGRRIASFKELSVDDARFLIDELQGSLGIAPTRASAKPRLDRDQARRAGLDGRKDGAEFASSPQMATAADLARIERLLARLGWDQNGLRRFLDSAKSPFARRGDKQIRTTSDANKVWWALKSIARRKGVWKGGRAA